MIHQYRNIGGVLASIGVAGYDQANGVITCTCVLVYTGQSHFFGTIAPKPLKTQSGRINWYAVEFVLPHQIPSKSSCRSGFHHQGYRWSLTLTTLVFGFVPSRSITQHQSQIVITARKQQICGSRIFVPIHISEWNVDRHFTQRFRTNTQGLHFAGLGNIIHNYFHTIKIGRKTPALRRFEIHLIFTTQSINRRILTHIKRLGIWFLQIPIQLSPRRRSKQACRIIGAGFITRCSKNIGVIFYHDFDGRTTASAYAVPWLHVGIGLTAFSTFEGVGTAQCHGCSTGCIQKPSQSITTTVAARR